eukprot:sb/3478245/
MKWGIFPCTGGHSGYGSTGLPVTVPTYYRGGENHLLTTALLTLFTLASIRSTISFVGEGTSWKMGRGRGLTRIIIALCFIMLCFPANEYSKRSHSLISDEIC